MIRIPFSVFQILHFIRKIKDKDLSCHSLMEVIYNYKSVPVHTHTHIKDPWL